jgi:hypothetical protein
MLPFNNANLRAMMVILQKRTNIVKLLDRADLQYYAKLSNYFREYYSQETERAFAILQHLASIARRYDQAPQADKIESSLNLILENFKI